MKQMFPVLDNSLLAVAISVATIVILAIAVIAFLLEQRINLEIAQTDTARHREERFHSLVQNASDIIAILTTNGVVNYVSLSLTRILGYDSQDWLGRKALEFVHPDDLVKAERLLQDAFDYPTANITGILRLKHAEDDWHDFEIVVNNLLNDSSVAGIIITCRDITERKQAALELKNRLQQQASIAQFGYQALAGTDLDTLMDTAANTIGQTLTVEYSEILELLPEGKELRLRAGIGWQPGIVGELLVSNDPTNGRGYTLFAGEPVIIEDLRTEIRFSGSTPLHHDRIVSGMSVIIPGKNCPYGVLGAYTTQLRKFNPDDIYFLEAMASVLSTAIERKQTEMLLHRYRLLSEHTQEIMLFTRLNGEIIEANNAALNAYGYKASELLSMKFRELRAAPRHCVMPTEKEQANSMGLIYETLHLRKDGSTFPVEISSRGTRLGGERMILNIIRNITERQRFEQALSREKELAQVTLQSIGDAVITTDAFGRIKSINPVAEQLTGWRKSEAQGRPLRQVFRIVNANTSEPVENPVDTLLKGNKDPDSNLLQGNQDDSFTDNTLLMSQDKREFAIALSAEPIRSDKGEIMGVVLVFRDVTESRQMAHQLSWQASHDPLTGLVNRREFENRLAEAVNSAKQKNMQHALCYLDLDKFKIVNDTCGHAAGDELLRQVTNLLQAQVRKSDTVARLGGDEFAVLVLECSLHRGQTIAEKILREIQTFRFVYNEKTFYIGVSIGLVEINQDTPNSSYILSAADSACYLAKNEGRNRICIGSR